MKPLLVVVGHSRPDVPLGAGLAPLESRRVAALPAAGELDPERPTVLAVDAATLAAAGGAARAWLAAAAERAAVVVWGGVGAAPPAGVAPELLSGFLAASAPAPTVEVALRAALRHAASLAAAHAARAAAEDNRDALAELTRAGLALGAQRDPAALLVSILTQARRLTRSDAGSIYLVERDGPDPDAPRVLAVKLSQNDSRAEVPFASRRLAIDHGSVAGFAAATGEPLVIDDAYALPAGTPYRVNSSFDEQVGYRTRSMLVIPMKSQRGEVVGVLQLINRKREPGASLATRRDVTRHVVPYTGRSVEHVTALAAQAAVSIENSMLHASIERLFDGFVAAAATAVEARDPTTYGHSRRVARLAVRLAEAVDQGWGVGAYRGARFSRDQLLALRYAALLHDFGKVAVREDVLVKERKLHPGAHARVRSRFVYLAQQTALDAEREKVALLRPAAGRGAGPAAADAALAAVDARRDRRLGDLRELLAAVDAANEPAPPTAATVALLERAAAVRYRDADGSECALLSDDELRHLRIARGNLDDAERAEVESHVAHTYRFLQQIPWTAPLAAVPAIAHTHHEKPNGRGYPRRLSGDAISVSARIIAVADVFDALTASDRSYKPAVPVPHALEVMRAEAAEGGLDADLVQTFAAAGLHLTAQVSGAHLAVGTAPGPD